MKVSLRQAVDADYEFVKRIYFETQRWITEELFGWRGDEVEEAKFSEGYHVGRSCIIVVENVDVGWLAIDRDRNHIELKDIYITEEAQNRGIGTSLISNLINEATRAGLPLRLSTAKINPALELYERLGFVVLSEDTHKIYMEYVPAALPHET